MENRINIAEMLKDCPKGMKLDCTMYEDVFFDYVDELNIIHCYIQYETRKTSITFNQHGTPNSYIKSKCVIFPKGKTTWEGFVPPCKFKDGDIVVCGESRIDEYVSIFKTDKTINTFYYHAMLTLYTPKPRFKTKDWALSVNIRLASEEEKQKLFDAIKDNGYEWNAEAKTLEKLIESKFKVGDKIRHKSYTREVNIVTDIKDTHYILDDEFALPFICQDEHELVPNKFDISTLIPFESRVLIRDHKSQKWSPAIWGIYTDDPYFPYKLIGTISCCCIPYEGNEHLLNTTNDCDEYYKTWE